MTLLLLLQLAGFLPALPPPPPPPAIFQVQDDQDRDGPDPAPLPGHGAYEHARGWICTKAETNTAAKNVQCACKEACLNGGVEDRACLTSCNSSRCKCHEDSSHCAPEVMPKPTPKKKGKR